MMNRFQIIAATGAAMAALAYGAPLAAHPDHETSKTEVRQVRIVHADGKAHSGDAEFAADCGEGRRFESSSSTGDDKKKHVSKMVICSDPGESDEAWAKTLKEALARVESSSDMPADSKAKIVADLKSEIAKIGN